MRTSIRALLLAAPLSLTGCLDKVLEDLLPDESSPDTGAVDDGTGGTDGAATGAGGGASDTGGTDSGGASGTGGTDSGGASGTGGTGGTGGTSTGGTGTGGTGTGGTSTGGTGGADVEWALSLDGPTSVEAGVPAIFTATLVEDGAASSEPVALVVSPDEGVSVEGEAVTFTLAGAYTVTALAEAGGGLEASLALEVVAGDVDSLALSLEAGEVEAGEVVGASWSAADAWGNPVDAAGVSLTVSPEGVEVLGDTLQTGPAGEYVVTAQLGAVYDSQPLTVSPGPASALVLSLEDSRAEVGETLAATVSAEDSYGNAAEVGSVSWEADPAEGVSFGEGSVSFEADGDYTITASAGGLSASAGVLVDSNGPLIVVTSPQRGEYLAVGPVTVTGTVTDSVTGVSSLTLNGSAVSVSGDGSFSVSASLEDGVNVLELAAADGDGNSSDVTVGVMGGEYLADGELIEDLMDLRIEDSALAGMGSAVSDTVDLAALSDSLAAANPVWDEDYSDLCFGLPTYFLADFEALDTEALAAAVDATANKLRVRTTLEGLSIDVGGAYAYCGSSERPLDNRISAEVIEVTTTLWISAGGGGVSASVDESSVSVTGYETDFGENAELTTLLGLAGVDIEAEVLALLQDSVVEAVEAALPAAIEDAFSDFALSQTLSLDSSSLLLDAWIRDLSLDAEGMTLELEGTLDASAVAADTPAAPGSLLGSAGHADLSGSGEELVIGLPLGTFNRMLHGAWQAGAFSQTLSHEDLGLDGSLVGLIFEGASTLELELSAQLAPVMLPGTGGHMYDFVMAELTVEVWGEVDGAVEHLATMSGWSEGDVSLRLGGGGLVMTTTLDGASLDVLPDGEADVADAEGLEALLSAFSESLTTGIIPEITVPLPEVGGLSLSPAAVEVLGGDWAAVECAVE